MDYVISPASDRISLGLGPQLCITWMCADLSGEREAAHWSSLVSECHCVVEEVKVGAPSQSDWAHLGKKALGNRPLKTGPKWGGVKQSLQD